MIRQGITKCNEIQGDMDIYTKAYSNPSSRRSDSQIMTLQTTFPKAMLRGYGAKCD